MALAEPAGQLGIGGSLAEDLLFRCAARAGQSLRDETRRPSVHITRVLEQVPDRPARAGRHRGGQTGPLRRAGEQFSLAAQCPDVVGNVEGGVYGRLHMGKDATTALARFPAGPGNATMEPGGETSGHGIHQRCPGRKVSGVTARYPPLAPGHIDLSDTEFWGWPMTDREG